MTAPKEPDGVGLSLASYLPPTGDAAEIARLRGIVTDLCDEFLSRGRSPMSAEALRAVASHYLSKLDNPEPTP